MSSTPTASAPGKAARLARAFRPTLAYWMETEVHVYGFSIAANVLLSFFPFLIVILTLCRHLLGWQSAVAAINLVLGDYFPDTLGEFVRRNLTESVRIRGSLQIASVFLLLFTANGVFEPLEVALNRIWGITKNRSFLKNQLVSLGLIFACGTLALASTVLTGVNARLFANSSGLTTFFNLLFLKMAALPVSVLMLFLIYWLLPNGGISARAVLPAAVVVGVALEILKYINAFTWSMWRAKLHAEYGPFYYSVTIILWSFLAAMIILGGAHWAARWWRAREAEGRATPK